MSSLEQAVAEIAELARQISHDTANPPPIRRFQADIRADVSPLAWLKAQSAYPQCYLRRRDQATALAAAGSVRTFREPAAAQQFADATGFPLLGGVQFYGQSIFVLPQWLLEHTPDSVRLSLFWDRQTPPSLDFLKTAEKTTALFPLPPTALHKTEKADKSTWCGWVEQALALIRAGKASKLVLANETDFHLDTPIDAKDFLAQSERKNGGCYHFLWAERADSQFVGSTPEQLFARHGRQLLTEALAGTAAVTDDADETARQAQWLLNDPKNLAENRLVAEGISQNLQPLADNIQIDGVQIKPLRKVQHLLRKIRADLKSAAKDIALLQAVHPTAAVSGLPQQAAKALLPAIETFDRCWYAGALGILSSDTAEFCVTIRSAFIEPQQIRIFAGAGIVEGSVPQEEWNEIERKAAGLISLLEQNENGEQK